MRQPDSITRRSLPIAPCLLASLLCCAGVVSAQEVGGGSKGAVTFSCLSQAAANMATAIPTHTRDKRMSSLRSTGRHQDKAKADR